MSSIYNPSADMRKCGICQGSYCGFSHTCSVEWFDFTAFMEPSVSVAKNHAIAIERIRCARLLRQQAALIRLATKAVEPENVAKLVERMASDIERGEE